MNPKHCLSTLLLAGLALAQSPDRNLAEPPRVDDDRARALQRTAQVVIDRVLHADAEPGSDGTLWSCGTTWKASFGRDGFTYVPAFAPEAPHNFPVRFRVASLRIGDETCVVAANVLPARRGDRVAFARGELTERYDLALDHVEQSFVLDTSRAGDVELTLAIDSELQEDAGRDGLQFHNEWGDVLVGDPFVVLPDRKVPITARWHDGLLHLHVPAALRGPGPLVIDPIIQTRSTVFLQMSRVLQFPDISYDHTNHVFLAVWQRNWSATDTDVMCEFFDEHGDLVAGSGAIVDITTERAGQPRVANLNWANRFLIAYEFVPTQLSKSLIVGRTRDGNANQVSAQFNISNPADSGNALTPDVGGDPSSAQASLGWAVVWTQGLPRGGKIARRLVASNTSMATPAEYLSPTTTDQQYSPQISHSNGATQVDDPAWLVVFSSIVNGSNVDVAAHAISVLGVIGGRVNVAAGSDQDWYPFVSSPATDAAEDATWFLITWERQGVQSRSFASVYDHRTQTATAPFDLDALGIGSYWARAESDGKRFVVAASVSVHTPDIALATIAWTGTNFVLHEAQTPISSAASFPQLVAMRNGGGPDTEYAAIWSDATFNPAAISVTRYAGYQPGTQIAQHALACHGLQLVWAGQPLVGHHMDFVMVPPATEFPAVLLGFPAAVPFPVCTGCSFGLRLDLPIEAVVGQNLTFHVPPDVRLVGFTVAVQGVSIGDTACIAGLHTTDMFELTIR